MGELGPEVGWMSRNQRAGEEKPEGRWASRDQRVGEQRRELGGQAATRGGVGKQGREVGREER